MHSGYISIIAQREPNVFRLFVCIFKTNLSVKTVSLKSLLFDGKSYLKLHVISPALTLYSPLTFKVVVKSAYLSEVIK